MSTLTQKHQTLKQATELALRSKEDFEALVSDVLTRVVIETLKTYQKKVNVGIEDSVADLLDNFKQQIARSIFDTAAGWRVIQHEPFLYPRNCRFCFTRGKSVLVVIEQEPQIRSLLLDSSLHTNAEDRGIGRVEPERFALALPYITFVFHFSDGIYTSLHCGWRTSPLQSLADELCRPLLPNIHTNMNVCMRVVSGAIGDSLASKTETALGMFWNTTFNSDLADGWWIKGSVDSRLRTPQSWAVASVNEPLFMLNLRLPLDGRKSVRVLLDCITANEEEPDALTLRHNLSEQIDKQVELFFSRIMKYLKKAKFEKFYPKDITIALADAMGSANVELADTVDALRLEVERLGQEVKLAKRPVVESAGSMWSEYQS